LKILPESSRGRPRSNRTSFGTLYAAMRAPSHAWTPAAVSVAPSWGSTHAASDSPYSSSGIPNTAQSWTPGMPMSTPSISAG
jgi:hypothetical protein